MEFWRETNSVRPRGKAQELFPEEPKGYVKVTKNLGNYASNKATAIFLRTEGNIAGAMAYEDIADRIYNNLPEWAKW